MAKSKRKWPTVVDLFSGCGAVTEALKSRHFRVVAAVDNDPIACKTYEKNHPTVRLYDEDIADVDPTKIKENQLNGEELDLLIVCAPCQPFSNQGKQNKKDARARLILHTIRFAEILKPKLIFFENVPGLTTPRFASVFRKLTCGLEGLGFEIGTPEIIDAADYGVPQRRNRCIVLARSLKDPPGLPDPITPEGKRITVKKSIGNLRSLMAGKADPLDTLHFARGHQSIALERLSHIPKDGGSRSSLPKRLVLPCHKDHSGHPDVYGRMKWKDVAPTLTTGCTDITKGRFAHPRDDRAITLREAARLQTFSDDYVFEGNGSEIASQIGNAVPVKLIDALVPTLRAGLIENT